MIRIVFLEGSPSLRARHILPILVKRFRITYITSGDDIPAADYEKVIRFPKAKFHLQHAWAYSRMTDRLYQENKIDFAYTYHGIGCFIRQTPQIALFGGSFLEDWKLSFRMIPWWQRPKMAVGFLHYVVPEIMTCRRAQRVLANSEALRQQLMQHHHLNEAATGVVRNGVTKEALHIFDRKSLPASQDILFVGRLHRRKGILALIQQFSQRRHIPLNFLIVGEGPQFHEIRRLAGQDKRIVLLGTMPQSKIFEVMRTTRYFLWPAFHEGFPNAFVEAMAAGHACVYYDIAANREVAGNTGIASPVGRPDLILDVLEELLARPHDAEQLAEAAHKRASEFTWETCAEVLGNELEAFAAHYV